MAAYPTLKCIGLSGCGNDTIKAPIIIRAKIYIHKQCNKKNNIEYLKACIFGSYGNVILSIVVYKVFLSALR
jgi:hypothetical protein